MYVSLYRRYRPQRFSDMVGQSAAVSVLCESLKEGRLGHAYLFSGPRGCGKTSAARLVAKSLNCQNLKLEFEPCGECASCMSIASGEHLDVIEIDGASNRGINEIRDLKSHVNLKPLGARYKVYIIDEVHMLTEAAFNALLKTLEEPPANVVFLLATTEPHKVPVTIRSRCQHIPFHRISIEDMVKRINYVCECENIATETEAVWEVARQADGALRDALSITEQAVALGKGSLTLDSVRDLTGGSNRSEMEKWISSLRTSPEKAAAALGAMLAKGISAERFTESLFSVFRDLWMYSLWGEGAFNALELSDAERGFIEKEAGKWTATRLRAACMFCGRLLPRTRFGMRLEVFSGLVMLELTKILENPANIGGAAAFAPRAVQSAAEAGTANEKTGQDQVRQYAAAPAETAAEEAGSIAAPKDYRPGFDALCADLGEGDFSKLISMTDGRNAVQMAAALKDCTLWRTDAGWKITFDKNPHAEVFFSIPQNMKALSKAVAGMWGEEVLPQDDQSAAPNDGGARREAGVAGAPTPADKRESEPRMIPDDTDRVLKLMGAEVLYIKEAGFDEAELTPGGEQ